MIRQRFLRPCVAQKFEANNSNLFVKYEYGNSVDCLQRCMSHTFGSECSLAVGESVLSSALMILSRLFTVSQWRYSNLCELKHCCPSHGLSSLCGQTC